MSKAGKSAEHEIHGAGHHRVGTASLVLGATGVVFGDIGTSPIYALKETFHAAGTTTNDIYGVVSLVFWALMIVVSIKYLTFVMRADNNGEGGILALLSLLPQKIRQATTRKQTALLILVLVGTALLFGDSALTPAISVLSATEGLGLINENLEQYAVPLTVVILLALFSVQSRGTHSIGRVFGPIMVLWFVTIGGFGFYQFIQSPSVIKALSPTYGAAFIAHNGLHSFVIFASVILAVTGAEALYADMGHFGAKPIRFAWVGLVAPALVLCYLGQAAVVSRHPEDTENPFFSLAPNQAMTVYMVLIATAATVIASQALITGAFSLSRQAMQLGLFPRITIHHTSNDHEGQIYVPIVNWLVGVTSIALVVGFGSSSKLAHAYVLAIAGTMAITTVAFHRVARDVWNWKLAQILPLTIIFLIVDLAFFAGTAVHVFHGGWVPVALGGGVLAVMLVWRAGYRALNNVMRNSSRTWQEIYSGIETGKISTVPGVGIFMASPAEVVPAALISHVTIMHSLPETVVVVTVVNETTPTAQHEITVDEISHRLSRVTVPVGYMETINLPEILRDNLLGHAELDATYYLSERRFLATDEGSLGHRTEAMFSILHRNSATPSQFYGLPYDRVISIGTRIEL